MHGKFLATGLTALLVLTATVGQAEAFGRQVTVWNSSGNGYTKSVDHQCAGGVCSTQSQTTTNSGAQWSRTGSCAVVVPGTYDCNGTVSGPRGGVAGYSGSVSVSRY